MICDAAQIVYGNGIGRGAGPVSAHVCNLHVLFFFVLVVWGLFGTSVSHMRDIELKCFDDRAVEHTYRPLPGDMVGVTAYATALRQSRSPSNDASLDHFFFLDIQEARLITIQHNHNQQSSSIDLPPHQHQHRQLHQQLANPYP